MDTRLKSILFYYNVQGVIYTLLVSLDLDLNDDDGGEMIQIKFYLQKVQVMYKFESFIMNFKF